MLCVQGRSRNLLTEKYARWTAEAAIAPFRWARTLSPALLKNRYSNYFSASQWPEALLVSAESSLKLVPASEFWILDSSSGLRAQGSGLRTRWNAVLKNPAYPSRLLAGWIFVFPFCGMLPLLRNVWLLPSNCRDCEFSRRPRRLQPEFVLLKFIMVTWYFALPMDWTGLDCTAVTNCVCGCGRMAGWLTPPLYPLDYVTNCPESCFAGIINFCLWHLIYWSALVSIFGFAFFSNGKTNEQRLINGNALGGIRSHYLCTCVPAGINTKSSINLEWQPVAVGSGSRKQPSS